MPELRDQSLQHLPVECAVVADEEGRVVDDAESFIGIDSRPTNRALSSPVIKAASGCMGTEGSRSRT